MRRHVPSIGLAALTGLLVLGCQEDAVGPEDITAAETLWKAHGLPSYRLELQISNGRTRRIEITVEDGTFQSGALLQYQADAEGWEPPIPLDEAQAHPYTVLGLFQTVREELSAGQRSVSATFNPNRGYVEHVELGAIAGSPPTVISVLSLEPL